MILETIRAVSTYAISNEAEFIQKVRAASEVRQAQAAKDLKGKLNKDNRRKARPEPKKSRNFRVQSSVVEL